MREMRGQRTAFLWLTGFLTAGLTGYSAWKILGTGVLSWHIAQREYHFMMAELLCLWLVFFFLFRRAKGRIPLWAVAGIAAAVCWLHEIFLPVLFTGCYVVYLILLGRYLGRKRRISLCWQFLLGTSLTISVFCLLSLAGLGSIFMLRVWVFISGGCLAAAEFFGRRRQNVSRTDAPSFSLSSAGAAMTAAIFALLLLQAGRLNHTVDFDSLWYGVRSHVMLDSGRGIYENLGTLGVVYTYPKGWEVLSLPLAGLPSYSFVTSMNLWVAGLALLALYETASLFVEKERALWAPFLAASVPGIMNMAGTAKADMMTFFCQLLMIQAVLGYGRKRDKGQLVMGLAAGFVSLAMKPTAVVFSTAIVGMTMFWLLLDRWRDRERAKEEKREKKEKKSQPFWLFLILSVLAWAGIWGRTLYLTGVPVTSIFYQVFQKIGFQVKYPFYASGFPAAGRDMPVREQARLLLCRLYGIFLNPQGEDMAHVIIAWGGILPLALASVAGSVRIGKRRSREPGEGMSFLAMLLSALLLIDLISLHSLSQIDGNYYMLTYGVIILAGCIWIDRAKGRDLRKIAMAMLMPAWLYGVILCGLTNWAWTLGNGGLHPVNKGYVSHVEAEREKRSAQGSAAIWDIFASNPKNRVIALGEHPGVLSFPCWVQSYVDVSGYWGNPEVVADSSNFLKYLQYADVDYLYMEKEYVDSSVRIYQIIRTLIEEGWLYDVRDENGNLIISVCGEREGHHMDRIETELAVFDEKYIQHP